MLDVKPDNIIASKTYPPGLRRVKLAISQLRIWTRHRRSSPRRCCNGYSRPEGLTILPRADTVPAELVSTYHANTIMERPRRRYGIVEDTEYAQVPVVYAVMKIRADMHNSRRHRLGLLSRNTSGDGQKGERELDTEMAEP
jgi:hypothetical protein